jgi:hypothetical protein
LATYVTSGFKITAFLCDSVDQVGGKLYMLGAGWAILNTAQIPFAKDRIGIAAVIAVPWTATNQAHKLDLWLEDQDGKHLPLGTVMGPDGQPQELMKFQGQFNFGRPAGIQAGDPQNMPFAANLDNVQFAAPGYYSFVLRINESDDENDIARLSFRVQFPNGVAVMPSS